MSGKGSRTRPLSIPRKVFEDNWERIFKKTKPEQNLKPKNAKKRNNLVV